MFLGGKGGPYELSLTTGAFCLVPRDVESFCLLVPGDPAAMEPEGFNLPCCPDMVLIIGEGGPCPCDMESNCKKHVINYSIPLYHAEYLKAMV